MQTAIGPVHIKHGQGRCEPCGQVGFAADELLGLAGGATRRARRMACIAGVHDPFRKAEHLLRELAGWSLDAETLRRYCHTAAAANRAEQTPLSVLGDGAEWIWNLAEARFHGADQLLDVCHAVEHLAVVGRAAVGEGEPLQPWLEAARRQLIGAGYAGVVEVVAQPPADLESQQRVSAVAGAVLNYFASHKERLGYAVRLHRGQTIGSGLVEGTIKELVNLRMKRTGAHWQAGRVGRFVEFLALSRSREWDECWTIAA